MVRTVRVVGIAIGSLVAAYLAVSLAGGLLLGWGRDSLPALVVTVVLGGLVFADILRRDGSRSAGKSPARV